MKWHYEVCKIIPKKGESYFAIREIYEEGKEISWTIDNIVPIGESKLDIIDILTMMLKDACYYKVRTIKE